jgi:hypothetical protein
MGRVFTEGLTMANKVKIVYTQMYGPVNVKDTNQVHWPTDDEVELIQKSQLEKKKINRVDIGMDDKGLVLGALKFYSSEGETSGINGKWPPNPNDVVPLPASSVDPDGSVRQIELTWNEKHMTAINFKNEHGTVLCGQKGEGQSDCKCGLGQTLVEVKPNQLIIGVSVKIGSDKLICGLAFRLAEL